MPIDYVDPFTKVRRSGRFDSRYDTESLRRLSLAGGGTFILAPSADSFAAAFSKLDNAEMIVQIPRLVDQKRSVTLYFLIPAIIFLVGVMFSRRLMGAIL